MTKFCLLFCLLLSCYAANAQFSDDFSDGDYTKNPAWQGNPGDFTINNNLQLQSNNTTANATFYISTLNELALKAQWELWVKLAFNTSSVNYTDVWLTSNSQDLNSNFNTGYFVRFGSVDDDICLYKKTGTGTAQKIIDGVNGLLNASSSTLKIKVIRTTENKWILLRDMTATGNSYRSEGEVTDNSLITSSYFGISIRQSTASFFQKHFFDDFIIKVFDENPSALKINSISATGPYSIRVLFDKPVNIASAEDVSRYHVNRIGNPISATVDDINGSIVDLAFQDPIKPNIKMTIIIDGVEDIFGSAIHDAIIDFYFYKANRYDVVIDEVFADPSPRIGLPTQKFIELKNVTSFPVNLNNWQLRDGNNVATLPAYELMPDSFLIITTASGLYAYKSFGKAIAVSGFPSLNIGGSQVALYDGEGSAIHSMSYDVTTYKNEVKKEGGFSLEMINTKYGCSGSENWIASNDNSGGTPGRKNSVDSDESVSVSINVTNAYLASPDTLYIEFNKSIDSATAIKTENFSISEGITIKSVEVLPPFFNTVKLTLATPAIDNKIYTVTVKGISDCAGNQQGSKNIAQFGIPVNPVKGDIVINEILFDPKPNGVDYLELYNNSDKVIDLSWVYIANRNSSGDPSSITRISNSSFLLLPSDFILLTTDPSATARDYPTSGISAFLKMNSLPSYPDDKGSAIIMDQQGNVLDEVNYTSKWHFSLIKDKEGVSLERISYDGPSDQSNFHSASSDAGYGTPGLKNSQSKGMENTGGEFQVSPEVFSPDNDGTDDFLTIYYSFTSPGFVTNIKIFDAQGRMVRYLEKNSLSGLKGYYRWDGLDDKSHQLPQGVYIIYFESFNEDGAKTIHKKTVVLARRLQ